jgi:hypothetical protein
MKDFGYAVILMREVCYWGWESDRAVPSQLFLK